MTEEEWENSTDPQAMLHFLRLRASDRKLRLFACACCRLVWDRLPGDHCRHAVEQAERYADFQISDEARERAYRAINKAIEGERGLRGRLAQAAADTLRVRQRPGITAVRVSTGRWPELGRPQPCTILRDLFSPFRRHRLLPALRDGPGAAIVQAVADIYEGRLWAQMPVLADALEDAGCTEPAILSHLRGPGVHARGCWPLDLILEKE
jgi:hypothetical protein